MRETVCAQLVEQVTDYLEGALSPEDLRSLEEHLTSCVSCENYINQVRTVIRLSARPEEAARTELDETVLQMFRSRKAVQDSHDDRAVEGEG
jgi:predicted anti-sigma-YlaC factor YlaD